MLVLTQVRMMEERLVKGEYCLSSSGVGSPPHSLPSTSGTQNDKIEDVHCACISKLETQVEEQVRRVPRPPFARDASRNSHGISSANRPRSSTIPRNSR